MLDTISKELKAKIQQFPPSDHLIFNNNVIEIDKNNFEKIAPHHPALSIAFVDGGQAEIISAGNFCLSFIRVGALVYQDNIKVKDYQHEFYLLTTAKYENNDLIYESKIFSNTPSLLSESDLVISSNHHTIRRGMERASISSVANTARRFAELSLCAKITADVIVLDGTLDPTLKDEEKYLSKLSANVCAIAKSSSLFTTSGNSPIVLLHKLSPQGCWNYSVEGDTFFVKLHPLAKHIFRYTGKKEFLSPLTENSTDALFLGYPYGLIAVDRLARVSNEEKKSLKMNILLKAENKEIAEYLSTTNAHDILDNLG